MLLTALFDPTLFQFDQAAQIADHVLQAGLVPVLGLVLVIAVLIVGGLAYVILRVIGLVSKQVDANSKQVDELHRQNVALDDQTGFLGRISDDMKANLNLNRTRAELDAATSHKVDTLLLDIQYIKLKVEALEKMPAETAKQVADVMHPLEEQIHTAVRLLDALTSRVENDQNMTEKPSL